jgi:acetoacetate decarboxylase
MKLVKTDAEVRKMLTSFSPTFKNNNSMIIIFETDPEFVREVLPPPLQPAQRSIGTALLQNGANYNGGGLFLKARYEDVEGDYCLAMPMNTDSAVIFGRELWGEPKKIAETDIARNGDQIVGTITRHGVEVVRVEAKTSAPVDREPFKNNTHFHFRYNIKPDATGIENTRLIKVDFSNQIEFAIGLDVQSLQFRESASDVYGNVPIKAVLTGVYLKMDCKGTGKYLAEVDDEKFLPYAFYRVDPYDLHL